MELYLGLLIFSFIITSVLVVPFINFLYRLKLQRLDRSKTTEKLKAGEKFINKIHESKIGTPVGGGLLVIAVVTLLYIALFPLISYLGVYISTSYPIKEEINIIFFTFLSFGLLGLYDDLMKSFGLAQKGIFGLKTKQKFILQWILGFIVAVLLYTNLKIDFINIPFIGILNLGILYIPFAAFVIVSFANAFNFTDGLDGLAGGLLMIYLFAFWMLSYTVLDTVLSVFIPLWIGALIAFLYFNVYPARIWLGDVGALSFGATLAVVGLLIGKIVAVAVIGGLFVVEGASSLIQIIAIRFFHRKVFKIAPLHHLLEAVGWEEPKIVMRAWLAGLMLAVFGLWLAVI